MGLSTLSAAHSQDPDLLMVMVFAVIAVTSVSAFSSTGRTDHPGEYRYPVGINFRKAIVGSRNVEYYNCIFLGSRASFCWGLLPGFFYPFFQVSDTVNRQILLFPQIIARVSTVGSILVHRQVYKSGPETEYPSGHRRSNLAPG